VVLFRYDQVLPARLVARPILADRPTDGHPADAKMLRDRLHAVRPGAVGLGYGAIPVRESRAIVLQRPRYPLTLPPRDFAQRLIRAYGALHRLHELLGPQVDLPLERVPGILSPDPGVDNPLVVSRRRACRLAKRCQ
jgi:hypothetical protein